MSGCSTQPCTPNNNDNDSDNDDNGGVMVRGWLNWCTVTCMTKGKTL